MTILSVDECRELHEKHAPSRATYELVWTHCEIVWQIAEGLMDSSGAEVDRELVRAGCLLHDIGVYRLYDSMGRLDHANCLRHGILGHDLLAEEGFPEYVCRFCSCHTGVGLTKDDIERRRLPLPPADYVAESAEERLAMYADKFHSKTTPPPDSSPRTPTPPTSPASALRR
ncbi:HD domain-containing protein [Streptomyces sp. NPDC058301]|uniref:HD domain-containing protein n=1 Tax=Streptomyces sp. NPDC058301 TaxID=3346436 RepID=UPI0036EC29DF